MQLGTPAGDAHTGLEREGGKVKCSLGLPKEMLTLVWEGMGVGRRATWDSTKEMLTLDRSGRMVFAWTGNTYDTPAS